MLHAHPIAQQNACLLLRNFARALQPAVFCAPWRVPALWAAIRREPQPRGGLACRCFGSRRRSRRPFERGCSTGLLHDFADLCYMHACSGEAVDTAVYMIGTYIYIYIYIYIVYIGGLVKSGRHRCLPTMKRTCLAPLRACWPPLRALDRSATRAHCCISTSLAIRCATSQIIHIINKLKLKFK